MRFDVVIDELVAAVPKAAKDVADLRAWWDGEDPPATILMATLGKAYVRESERLSESMKERFFSTIERLLRDGDQVVQDAVATGLLEAAVLAVERTHGDRSSTIDNHAGPLALQYLKAWDDFCLR